MMHHPEHTVAVIGAGIADAAVARALARAGWRPKQADAGLLLDKDALLYVPAPDMPALCRRLLDGMPATWSLPVDGLHRGPLGWQVHAAGARLAPWLTRWAECEDAPALFPAVDQRCNSFSQWWARASCGLGSAAELLAVNEGSAW